MKYYDEWTSIVERNAFMSCWKEAEITFKPTYKYIKGSLAHDTKEGRLPAWCDRILFREECAKMEVIKYGSISLPVSDHMPVFLVARIYGQQE